MRIEGRVRHSIVTQIESDVWSVVEGPLVSVLDEDASIEEEGERCCSGMIEIHSSTTASLAVSEETLAYWFERD